MLYLLVFLSATPTAAVGGPQWGSVLFGAATAAAKTMTLNLFASAETESFGQKKLNRKAMNCFVRGRKRDQEVFQYRFAATGVLLRRR